MKWSDRLFSWHDLLANKILFGITAGVFAYAAAVGFQNRGTELVGYLTLLFFALWLCWDGLKHALPATAPADRIGEVAAWCILLAAIAVLCRPSAAGNVVARSSCLLAIVFASICRFNGWRSAAWLFLPFAACIFLVPFRTQLMLYISYPMRTISTLASAGILGFFDSGVKYDQTTIYLSATQIGITDACSGIAQIEAMFLLAYWIVGRWNRALIWKGLHYLFLFPAIMIANGLRIIVTILLFYQVGNAVFGDLLHVGLGYAQVIVTIGIFYIAGYVLPEKAERKNRK